MISTQALIGLLILGFAVALLYCQIRAHRDLIKQLRREGTQLREAIDAHDRALDDIITTINKGQP